MVRSVPGYEHADWRVLAEQGQLGLGMPWPEVMCEVISAVASAEKEAIQVQWLRKVLERVAGGPDKRINQQKLQNRKALLCNKYCRISPLSGYNTSNI